MKGMACFREDLRTQHWWNVEEERIREKKRKKISYRLRKQFTN